jgi:hypothetical protein
MRDLLRRLEEAKNPFRGMRKSWAQGGAHSQVVFTVWFEHQPEPQEGVPKDEWPDKVAEWRFEDPKSGHIFPVRNSQLAKFDRRDPYAKNDQVLYALELSDEWERALNMVYQRDSDSIGVEVYRHPWQVK